MPLFGLRFAHFDEDEKAQKNTFTRWINFHLEEHSSSGRIEDLFEDIRDGVLLCHLIEVLTGEALVSFLVF
uniref:Calponin-homology (CH) domain-containing protein n=1 Tax=Caenorhabditis japonica TaxID=281687 RepID=A0A8R1ELV1_CAEJA